MVESSPKKVENTVGKGEIARYECPFSRVASHFNTPRRCIKPPSPELDSFRNGRPGNPSSNPRF